MWKDDGKNEHSTAVFVISSLFISLDNHSVLPQNSRVIVYHRLYFFSGF